jgi:O-antigen/teichoic acid export membrane protein/glycosyltransferase involved in cell wall biosynthesis
MADPETAPGLPGQTASDHAFDLQTDAGLSGTVVRGAGIAALGHGGAQALTLLSYLVLARLISPAEFGEFAAASILLSAGTLLAESGMLSALIHRRDRLEEAASTAVVATIAGGIALGLLALLSAPLIGLYFDNSRITALAAAMSGVMVLRAVPVVPDALLQRRFSVLRRTITEPIAVVAFGVSATIAAANDLGPWALVIGYYALAATEAVVAWALVRWRPRLRQASYAMWRELVAYGRHVLGGTAILRVGDLIPAVLLGRFTGTAALGQFRYANRMSEAPFAAILATGSWLLFPAFARISDQPARFKASFLRSLNATSTLGMPAGLIFIPLGVPIAVLGFGSVWRDAGEAMIALSPLTGAASLTSVSTEAFKGAGRPELLVRAHFVAVAVGAVAMVALLPIGLIGVASGVTLGAIAGAAYSLWKAREVIGTTGRELADEIWPSAVAALAMAGVIWLVESQLDAESHATIVGLVVLAAEIVFAAVVYGALLLAFSQRSRREARLLSAAARRKLGRETAPTGPIRGESSDAVTTVVIPAYNAEHLIERTVRSALAQTDPRLEIVVVDDGSRDGTAEVVARLAAEDPRIDLVRQENQGVAAARNTGIARARTPYVSFLDNDDLWMPCHLEKIATALEAAPEAGIANADGWVLDDLTGRVRRAPFSAGADIPDPLPGDADALLVELAKRNFIWGSTTVRKLALDDVGGFDPELTGPDDYDLWLRIATAGHGYVRPPGRLIVQRIHPDSQGHDWPMMLRQTRRVLERLANDPRASEAARGVARNRLPELDRAIRFETARGPRGLYRATERLGGRLRRRALYNRLYHRTMPAELREAFGDRL